jgi:NADH:ubiquinone oxidoreductase subunit 4 (subunit M)
VGGNVGDFVLMILPAMTAFGWSVYVLITRFGTLHTKVISGLGSVMPRLSVFFILSLLALQFTPLLYGFELLSKDLVQLSFLSMLSQSAGWLLLNWGGFRLIEQIIYGKAIRRYRYRDLGNREMVLVMALLMANLLFFIYYAGRMVG